MLDGVSDGRIFGWAWDPTDPTVRLELAVSVDGRRVGSVVADRERPDLREAGIGDGRHGFELTLPSKVADGRRHAVDVHAVDGQPLANSPWEGWLGAVGAKGNGTAPTRFRSRFGGLWTDLSNAPALADGKAELGSIDADEHALLSAFIEDGYVILRQAVPAADVAALRQDVEELYDQPAPSLWVEESGVRGTVRLAPRHRDARIKILDLHAHLESARSAMFAPRLARFLQLLFERPPLAFQSLYFERGVEQPLHCDTAFVRCSSPVEFAAAWIALEPIVAGSGELELYPGSQALPEKLFRGGNKWAPPAAVRYSARLRERCERAGLRNERFLAEPGDVLVWAADLAHGGSRVDDPRLTRRSFVVHYCPTSVDPIYQGSSAPHLDLGGGTYQTHVLR